MYNHLVPPSSLCLCTPPQLCLCRCIVLPPHHLCCVYKPKPIPFISSTIVYLIHFTDHGLSLSYLPYLVIHVTMSFSLSIMIYQETRFCLNIFIHELTLRLIHQSLILQTTWCQKWDSNKSKRQYKLLEHLSSSSIIKSPIIN